MTTTHRIRCTNGSCRQETAWHWALWPALRHGARMRAGGCTAHPVASPKPYFYSAHAGARYVHRTKSSATIWERGVLRLVGARALCGQESCLAVMSATNQIDGLRPCLRCARAAGALT